MGRGRKPKGNAQRRGGLIPSAPVEAEAIVVSAVEMPAMVAANPDMAAKWTAYIADREAVAPEDAPLLESWCFWAVIADQCSRDLDEHPDPDLIRRMEKATTMLMRLGDALNMSPVSRQRAGLISAMTQSTQADVVSKARSGYARFKEAADAAE